MSKDFVIENGVLVKYNGSDENVTIPEGVTEISDNGPQNLLRIGNDKKREFVLSFIEFLLINSSASFILFALNTKVHPSLSYFPVQIIYLLLS